LNNRRLPLYVIEDNFSFDGIALGFNSIRNVTFEKRLDFFFGGGFVKDYALKFEFMLLWVFI
jgi:hypothetical protein